MLIVNLKPIRTTLSKLKEVPDTFFLNLEASRVFGNNLFPEWLTNRHGNPIIFGNGTELRNRFKAIYDKYKAIRKISERRKIINAYFNTNKISNLCNNDNHLHYFELNDLHVDIRKEIDDAFLYLYKSALNHPPFENHVNDNIKNSLKRFTVDNSIDICPFCGLEMLLQIEGQARLPLDHWLNKDRFPFASINFDNLIPIGTYCNSNGVKGDKNVLKYIKILPKKKAYYPYLVNNGIIISIACTEEPSVDNEFGNWDFSLKPNLNTEKDFFESWDFIFNISTRFKSYFEDILIAKWKDYYVEFIGDGSDVRHAQTVDEFKANLRLWRKTYNLKRIPGSYINIRFIDYLINDATKDFLVGVVEDFKSKVKAGVI